MLTYLTRLSGSHDVGNGLLENGVEILTGCELHELIHQHGGEGASSKQCRRIHCNRKRERERHEVIYM